MRSRARRSSAHHGAVVKTTGDGFYAAFGDRGRRAATQRSRCNASSPTPRRRTASALRLRCGLHVGVVEHRDNDYFGRVVNRAARIMTAAHGGQVLLSQAVATLIGERLPADVALRDLGTVRLRDLAEPGARLSDRRIRSSASDFPALRARIRAEQPAAADNVLRRARARARRGHAIAAQHAAPDADRSRRPGQDAAVAATGGRRDGRLSRRHLVRRARPADRCATGAAGGCFRAGGQGGRRAAHHRGNRQASSRSETAGDPRQLRAPGRRVRRARGALAAGRPERQGAGIQPRASARRRRDDFPGSVARCARARTRRSRSPR